MDKIQEIKGYASSLGLTHTRDDLETIIHEAEKAQSSYVEFIQDVLGGEIKYRQNKAKEKRIKEAGFPYKKYLKDQKDGKKQHKVLQLLLKNQYRF